MLWENCILNAINVKIYQWQLVSVMCLLFKMKCQIVLSISLICSIFRTTLSLKLAFFSLILFSSLFEYCFGAKGYIVITSKYAYYHPTSRPPADVSLPFPEYRCGEVDSCACLLSRQENHRAEVKKHVLPNVSPFETACPESRLKRFPGIDRLRGGI